MNKTVVLDKHEMVVDRAEYESMVKELTELRKEMEMGECPTCGKEVLNANTLCPWCLEST